jgi:hypothetical protein
VDPKFVQPGTNGPVNYRLQSTSSVLDKGAIPSALTTNVHLYYWQRFGESISFDLDRKPRPVGGNWDPGAYQN